MHLYLFSCTGSPPPRCHCKSRNDTVGRPTPKSVFKKCLQCHRLEPKQFPVSAASNIREKQVWTLPKPRVPSQLSHMFFSVGTSEWYFAFMKMSVHVSVHSKASRLCEFSAEQSCFYAALGSHEEPVYASI